MNYSNTVVQLMLFFIFILVLLFINKYFIYYINNTEQNISTINNIKNTREDINKDGDNYIDPLTTNNKNDLKIVNNKIKVYDLENNSNYELINELLPKHEEHKIPSKELDYQFMNNNIIYKDDNANCNIKFEKTDLPIVNIKACNLSNNTSMRLSEYK
jgi:hypothetical protein